MNLEQDLAHLRNLDNDSLLRSLKRHVGSSNRLNALVLAHLPELDARATRAIEFHHEHLYALGGPHCTGNITLRCRSHDELAAERAFGRELVRAMKHAGSRA